MSPSYDKAREEWLKALGAGAFSDTKSVTDLYSRTCVPSQSSVLAVLYPSSVAELGEVLRISRNHHVPIYPISRGRNWGYGSSAPAKPDGVIVDLSRMNRIIEIHPELAYAIVEPGVTPKMLADAISERGLNMIADVTGAPPDSSLIGNICERGYGHTRYGDHYLNCAGMEVLLPTGELVQLGMGRFGSEDATYSYKWGLGPVLDGIFTQSNFGIITRLGIWLMPRPVYTGWFSLELDSDEALLNAIDSLRSLRLSGTIRSALHIANDLRLIANFQSSPRPGKLLSENEKAELRRKWRSAVWTAGGVLTGSKGEVKAAYARIRSIIGKHGKLRFISQESVKLAERIPRLGQIIGGPGLKEKIQLLKLIQGEPSSVAIRGAYWGMPEISKSSDPNMLDDGCGVFWYSPVFGFTRARLSEYLAVGQRVVERHSFDFNVSLNFISERACSAIQGVFFDRRDEEQTLRARECYHDLAQSFAREGLHPYRTGSLLLQESGLFSGASEFEKLCGRIKSALDPEHILSPGRYGLE